jgi:hypothetical protein
VGGLTIATLVVADIRQATAIDNGLVAYTQAESGLEQSLYDVRQTTYCDQVGKCNDTAFQDCVLPSSTSGGTAIRCNRKLTPAPLVQMPYLERDQNFQLDFNPPVTSATIQLNWSRILGVVPDPQLEVSFLESYVSGGETKLRVYRQQLGFPYTCSPALITDTACTSYTLQFPGAGETGSNLSLYQLRLRALKAPITGLLLTPNVVSSAGYLDVWSQGTEGRTTQTLQTTIPRRAPAYGFSDYVIFSEQDIVK